MSETKLLNEIRLILQEKYGYSPEQIATEVAINSDFKERADLVVFDDRRLPEIIVEVINNKMILPISEYELKEHLLNSNANYGLIYNGIEQRSYTLSGNNLVSIKEIPKKKSIVQSHLNSQKNYPAFTAENIWRMAEAIRGSFYDYSPFLQVLSLKILDEKKFDGTLYKKYHDKYHDKPLDERYLYQLMEIGKREFPILFSSTYYLNDRHAKNRFISLFEDLWNFSIQTSDVELVTKAILKLSPYEESIRFPSELTFFMLSILTIPKGKKTLILGGQDYTFDVCKSLIMRSKIPENEKAKYLKNNLSVIEPNSRQAEIIRLISLLRGEPFQIFEERFLQLDQRFIEKFEYVLGMPPLGGEVQKEEIEPYIGNHGRQLINYVLMKLNKSSNSKLKATIVVPTAFLSALNSKQVRHSISEHGSLKALFQFPPGLLVPYTPISITLVLIDLAHIKEKSNVFLSKVPELEYTGQKLNPKTLNKIMENFRNFEHRKLFKESAISFVLPISELKNDWTVADKTPEMRRLTHIRYGTKLSSVGTIFYGKAGTTDTKSKARTHKIPFLRISDIKAGLINSPVQKSVTIKDDPTFSEVLIQENDVVLSCQGTIGKLALAEKKDIGILPSPQIAIIRPNVKRILPEFLLYSLNSEKVQLQFKQKSKGMFIPRLNKDDLLNIIVPNPPVLDQQKIVLNFRNQKRKIKIIEKKLEQAKKNLLKMSSDY